ncbi:B3 domain-containing protein Os05g0481400-like isoform X2 [Asparagus officinalis]|uniref:B3 domain-containing protein Os05g0481400-like isoform X2 n=1 Tax=Asparagus officinalis TaxID=4686 RepID=UPI00098E66EE|nr:B3 domain-containing protein Os05g0481400-like isoform X2 [Asparagus officinalis]
MTDVESNSYEEIRRKRVQENLKHLEDLGISKISKGLLEVAQIEHKLQKSYSSPKPKKKFEISELRRSSRERKPGISYSEEAYNEELVSHRRSYKRSMNKNADRAYTGRIASYQQIAAAVKRAEKLEMDLKSPHPSFVKTMVRSHVSSCFWLGLPTKFCKDNLPLSELRMVLEDEEGKEYDAVYIGKRTGLSGGWRGFALDHNLEDGDALIFELTEPARFKIYIIKAIPEESSYSNKKESTESTAALESITEEDLPSSQEQTLKTRSKKQAQRAGSKKQAQQPKKRVHSCQLHL